MSNKNRCVIYSRVSTVEQNTANQSEVLLAWAKSRGLKIIRTYLEESTAWKAGHQRELSRLIRDARRRTFDIVLVWSLDRLSREGALAILELVHKLKYFNIQVISYQEGWTEAPGELGELLYALSGWVARMESQRRSERTKAGIERHRKASGGNWGRPPGVRDKKQRKRRKTLVAIV